MIGIGVKEFVETAVVLALGADRVVREIKERKAKKNGLRPNPTRCREMADALKTVGGTVTNLCVDMREVKTEIVNIKEDIKELKNI